MKNRIFLTAFLLSVLLPSWAQIGGDYNPESPSDPGTPQKYYTLSVQAIPEHGGSFNIRSERVVAGETYFLYAYTSSDFVFKCWMIGDEVLSEDRQLDFVMPSHDVQITGKFEYNPASPASPNQNFWSKETGDVIVDTFDPGNLSAAIYTAISGSNGEEVQTIIVAGKLSVYDFSVANDFPNCTLLDLSRVTGVTEVPSYAFDYSNLESIYLPASIEKIGYYAFGECSNLASITLYAMTPPTLEDNVFSGVPDGLVVYVPAAAIAQYQDSEAWSKFTILPIQEDIRSITVSLPSGVKASDYAKMWLELTNTKSGQRMHYIMTDRSVYTFANIIKNTSWNVVLRNERGDVFGKIDNVEVKDEDVSVSFASLSKPLNVSLKVHTPDGKNVTEQTQITWTDASGNYIAQGTSLSSLPIGCQLNYSVALSQDLAMLYGTPKAVAYTLKDGNNSLTCKLKAIKQVKVTGKVKDATSGLTLSGAVISASQTFGGKYSKTINGKTDANGVYTLTVYDVPTNMAFAATDYISQSIVCDELIAGKATVDMNDVSLKPISGATINVGFTYTNVDGETQNWYNDYQNVGYTLYNKTRKKAINQFNVQYPQIVLLEEVSEGDVLELTAESKTQAFKPVKATATITANQTAEAQFSIVELGQLKAEYSQSGNVDVVASLYDASGKLVKTYNYRDMSLTISNLADGKYTLVSMGSSQFFNSIYDLAQLPQSGLKAGTDYVQNAVTVKSGKVTTVNIDLVPKLDESKLYYTGDNTSFTVNKPSIVVGNYLTLTGHLSFKPAYESGVSNVQMIVDLPESSEFVESSVMVGNSTGSYTLNGHQLTIPMARYSDRVRFCVIPTAGGEYAPSAFAQFKLNGKTIKQPIGSANYTAKDLSVSVPSVVTKTSIPVSGTAIGTSTIDIYDNGVLICQTTSKANGTWATTCELNKPYNLSRHPIYAKVTTKQGVELQSECVVCEYNRNAIEVKNVNMSFYNAWMRKTISVNFNLIAGTNDSKAYSFYTATDFTFVVDFTQNDTTVVKDVNLYVFTDDNKVTILHPIFDKDLGKFVASHKFSYSALPKNVSVSFTSDDSRYIDSRQFDDARNEVEQISQGYQDDKKAIDSFFEDNEIFNLENYKALCEQLGISPDSGEDGMQDDSTMDGMSESEIEEYLDNAQASFEQNYTEIVNEITNIGNSLSLDGLQEQVYENGYRMSIEKVDGIDEDQLIEMGYVKLPLDDGTFIYIFTTNSSIDCVNMKENVIIHVTMPGGVNKTRAKLTDDFKEAFNKIEIAKQTVQTIVEDFHKRVWLPVETLERHIKQLTRDIENINRYIRMCNEGSERHKFWTKRLKDVEHTLAITKTALKWSRPLLRILAGAVPVADYLMTLKECYDISKELASIYESIPDPCDNDHANANWCKVQDITILMATATFAIADVIAEVTADVEIAAGAAASVASGGASLAVSGWGIVQKVLAQLGKYALTNATKYFAIKQLKKNVKQLRCEPDPDPDSDPDSSDSPDQYPKPTNPDMGNIKDPSGFVYEGVLSNRLEGVMSTIYYKEEVEDMYGDLHENIVLWDAEEYAQENPLFTDEDGMYAWDVPNGLWQVKFEKEGYETTYSEWLPVPPPQLDINIPMKQNVQPTVKAARAFQDAVEFEFDKYMMPELLTTENITVMVGKKAVTGTIKLLNEEVSREGETETFASKVRFNAAKPFMGTEVTLMVSNRVKSYAGIRMQDDFSQQFTIEEEVRQIDNKEVIKVAYGHNSTVSVAVLPASAAAGKTLKVKSSSAMILSTDAESFVLDKEGKAEINVHGELPGTAALTYSVNGYDLTATSTVNVVTVINGDVNGDGEVNAVDIVVLQNYLSGRQTAGIDESAADADGDGNITAADVPAIVAIILNKR